MVPDDLRIWLIDTLEPAWIARAVASGEPGYVEYLTPAGEPTRQGVKTTLVTARLVYVFSHLHMLSGSARALDAARHGVDFLLERCAGPDGAFRHAVTPDGGDIDARADLYDLAFAIFALAWYGRASGDATALLRAEATMRFIETRLAHPEGGFAEDSAGTLPRRQNPHMHLLEACHAMAETSGEARWLARADALVALMRDRMVDREPGTLGEFFTADWRAAEGAKGALREPGHHFEWVWLLYHHARLTGDGRVLATADRLYEFALAHGMDALADGAPVALDEVERAGAAISRTKLFWPQTEAIKAFAAQLEFRSEAQAGQRLDAHLAALFSHYIDPETAIWTNQLDATGQPIVADLPVRVLYHLVLAIAEAARVKALPRG